MQSKPAEVTRVYLAVPFAEKDEAKTHGARWDAARRQWWIERQDIDKHPGITRWIADNNALPDVNHPAAGREQRDEVMSTPVRTLPTTFDLPACACSTPPWEHCEHTMKQS